MLAGAASLDLNKSILRRLNSSPVLFVAYVSVCSFITYSCMYGFRKPFTVGMYEGVVLFGVSYKVCLVIAQVLGYMLSKFYGIRFISEMRPERRARYILVCIGVAWASLFLFALIPPPFNVVCMFINGLPLGMVWGLVFGFLEGRRTTELMGAVLTTSFIFASGLAKTVGKWLQLSFQVSDWWMPFIAGAIFVVPLLISVWLLSQTPPPSAEDIAHRNIRLPMNDRERWDFLRRFGWSMVPVVIAYATVTIGRDFCEDFANELWAETGYRNNAAIFTQTASILSVAALALVGSFFIIKNNYRAFKATHYLIMMGVGMSILATLLYNAQVIGPFAWMVVATGGIYLGYLPFNCLFFERMLSVYKVKGNVGFLMYIADAFGYLGTILVLLVKEFMTIKYNWVHFFSFLFYASGTIGILLFFISLKMHSAIYGQAK